MKRIWHVLARGLLVSTALLPIYVSYLWPFLKKRWLRRDTSKERWSRLHARNAERFYRLAVRMRGALIKVGQIISARVDVVPEEWSSRLSGLQDKVPATAWDVIAGHLEEELGGPPDEVFETIEREAVAAASFGQVHRATTRGGEPVALKIRYPDIQLKLAIDMFVFRRAVPMFNVFVPKIRLAAIYEEISRALTVELDYEQEAEWTRLIHDNLAEVEDVVVPRVIPEHTTRSIICTSWFEGYKITDRAAMAELGLPLDRLIELVLRAYVKMIFVDGVFQSDPHPGNLMFQRGDDGRPILCVLDFGQVKILPEDFQRKLVHSAVAFMGRDVAGFEEALVGLGLFSAEDAEKMRPVFREFFDRYFDMSPAEAKKVDYRKIRKDVKAIVDTLDGIHIPIDIVLYGRTFGLLTGVIAGLDPDVNGFEVAKPMIVEALMKPANPVPLGASAGA